MPQLPFEHVTVANAPAAHALPQAPQLLVEPVVSTQPPSQFCSGCVQPVAQRPWLQTFPPSQVTPHLPQFPGSPPEGCASHPSLGFLLQSSKPGEHARAQPASPHSADAFGCPTQAAHAPGSPQP
jgi:hypothetical protein